MILKMFRIAKMRKPSAKSRVFLMFEVLDMKAKKEANIVKAMREYKPEQGMSTEKLAGFPAAVVSIIVGAP